MATKGLLCGINLNTFPCSCLLAGLAFNVQICPWNSHMSFPVVLKQEETLFSVVGVLRYEWELWELCPARQKLLMDMTKTESDKNQGKIRVNGRAFTWWNARWCGMKPVPTCVSLTSRNRPAYLLIRPDVWAAFIKVLRPDFLGPKGILDQQPQMEDSWLMPGSCCLVHACSGMLGLGRASDQLWGSKIWYDNDRRGKQPKWL